MTLKPGQIFADKTGNLIKVDNGPKMIDPDGEEWIYCQRLSLGTYVPVSRSLFGSDYQLVQDTLL